MSRLRRTVQLGLFWVGLFIAFLAQARDDLPVASGASVFAATGLLAHAGETAEEILLRAHAHDPRAAVLAALGYGLGVGGFPHEPLAARGWVVSIGVSGDFATGNLMSLLYVVDRDEPEDHSLRCAMAARSHYAVLFNELGLVDLNAFCSPEDQAWLELPGERQALVRHELDAWEEKRRTVLGLARELRVRPVTSDDSELLATGIDVYGHTLLALLALSGRDPAVQTPDWSEMRLVDFFLAQRHAVEPGKTGVPEMSGVLLTAATSAVARQLGDRNAVLEVLRLAHRGDARAMRRVAANYGAGLDGFPLSPDLHAAWLQRVGFENGDALCLVLAGISLLLRGDHGLSAYILAEKAESAGRPAVLDLARALRARAAFAR